MVYTAYFHLFFAFAESYTIHTQDVMAHYVNMKCVRIILFLFHFSFSFFPSLKQISTGCKLHVPFKALVQSLHSNSTAKFYW